MSSYERHLIAGTEAAARYALAVPRNLTSGAGGRRLGRRGGSSLEFQEYREYRPGDDLRHVDWSAYGRSDRLIVKLFREEVDPHLDLLLDGSCSMALPHAPSVKAAATAALAAFLAEAAGNGGYSHSAWLLADGCQRLAPAGAAPRDWQGLAFDSRVSGVAALDALPPRWRPRGVRVLLSDLFWEEDPRLVLSRLAQGAGAVVVLRLLAREDAEPSAGGFERLVDSETGQVHDLLVDAAALRRYAAAFEEHERGWRTACRETGAVMVTLGAERLLDGFPAAELRELVELEVLDLR